MGRISAVIFAVGVLLIVLTSTVFGSVSYSIGSLNVIGAINFVVLLAALATGATALIRERERSWMVWVATVIPAFIIGFEILTLLIPGD